MTKKQHKQMLHEIEVQFDESMTSIINDDTFNIIEIKHNPSFSEFDVTLSTTSVGLYDSFSTLYFYFYGGVYGIFTGKASDITVNFYGLDGSLIETANSANTG